MATLYLKTITLPSGTTYELWDTDAHNKISSLEEQITAVFKWLGVTTTPLTDGATTNPIVIGGNSVTATTGGVAQYQSLEFVFNGTAWQAFGEAGSFGALAFKDTASASYTPGGTISATFNGTAGSFATTITPSGTVSKPTFTGTSGTVTVSGNMSGASAAITTGTGSANYTPSGTVSQPTFTGNDVTFSGTFKPSGTVSTPTITVTPTTTTVKEISSLGSLPSLSFTVSAEDLKIDWNAGATPTSSSKTVATGISSATSTQPTFTGTSSSISTSGKATGTVSKPTFSGTGVDLEVNLQGGTVTATGTFTPSGTISTPTFTGTGSSVSTNYTPSGSVTANFTGTTSTITVS